jgi:hypothetical protein
MFVIVLSFEEGDLVIPINEEKAAKRLYSIVRLLFPSVPVSVYQIVKVA